MTAMVLPALDFPVAQITEPQGARPHFVHELITRLDRYCLIRVNGTPASGKTTMMNLEEARVEKAGGWTLYLKALVGVPGRSLRNHPCYILVDEAHESYWDKQLWGALFKSCGPGDAARIVLFTRYGTTEGYDHQPEKVFQDPNDLPSAPADITPAGGDGPRVEADWLAA
ncbi:hypothetical protein ASPACDRAFT_47018 [Aspergillus aculeatus ATCC 16872]|uniref:Uncharacterized protein n=1 Tax=Aspergillus aculeatus (strain ATCC 16872 / CBS 172.66 / WB 5094) TaxID=690307 RepID=A0A1L9WJB9_ASPA1|nr:uncharacterized protein ASPACDRAFT_47018 [Aspergillus aculeatus ATCC 16872]OJJ96248.1 hypothetical protein ASPACDRAFT_47018 [Aspergillus aculeatus ATCC 16872]